MGSPGIHCPVVAKQFTTWTLDGQRQFPSRRRFTVTALPLTGSRYDPSSLDTGFPPRGDFLEKRVEMRDVVLIEKTRGERRAKTGQPQGGGDKASNRPESRLVRRRA